MARRRNSPAPDRLHDLSDSDDMLSHPSEDELFLEQEDPQGTFRAPPSAWVSFLSFFRRDPHAPRSIPLSNSQTRRQRRRARRAARRAKRRGTKLNTESSVMYEADRAADSSQDDDEDDEEDGRDWSDGESWRSKPLQTQRRSERGMCRVFLLSMLACVLSVVIVFGTLQFLRAKREANASNVPVARPSKLFNNGTSNFGPTTILISLDGFRADFLERGLTPALSSLVVSGVSPRYMTPSFPSVTFSNHWTLVTGLHPESHGIVSNSFWDESLQEEFFYTDPSRSMFPKWWASTGAEALWTTAEKQGIRTAVHMWPGSEAGLQPPPTYLDAFKQREDLSRKVRSVLSWLDLPSPFDQDGDDSGSQMKNPRPQFISMYVPDVDTNGHLFGPNSTDIDAAIIAVDRMVGDLLSGLGARNLTDIVNVVVVSDHGMASTSRSRLIQFEDLVDPQDVAHIDGWPLYGLRLKEGIDVEELHSKLKDKRKASGDNPGWSVYTKETMPKRWHYTANPRIAPLFLIPDVGWSIVTRKEMDLSNPINENAVYHPKGIHGYDNEDPLMRAIFVARGPAFHHPPGSRLEPFQNTEVYNIVCQSLGVVPMANNATLASPLALNDFNGDGKEGTGVQASHSPLPTSSYSTTLPSETNATDANPPDPDAGKDSNASDPEDEGTGAGESSKVKGKINELWDHLRQGFEKLKGWVTDKFGAKKADGNSS